MALRLSNTMLKHLGVCRAAGGEKPPKSEGGGSSTGSETVGASHASGGSGSSTGSETAGGGGSERQRAGELTRFVG